MAATQHTDFHALWRLALRHARRPDGVRRPSGLFMPGGTGAWKDKGLFRREVPDFNADLCTGCMECTLVCPDAAIPNTVLEIHELVLTGIKHLQIAEAQREALRAHVYPLSEAIRAIYRSSK